MKSKLVIFNYWKGPSCQIWWTDVCRTFVFLCIKLNINYAQEHSSKYNLRQSDFSTPRYNSVTYGRYSLRHLGPKLWAKLSSDDRSAKTLYVFKRRIRGKDLTELIEIGCRGLFDADCMCTFHYNGKLVLRPIRISFPRWVELFIDKNTSECREISRIVSENFLFI